MDAGADLVGLVHGGMALGAMLAAVPVWVAARWFTLRFETEEG